MQSQENWKEFVEGIRLFSFLLSKFNSISDVKTNCLDKRTYQRLQRLAHLLVGDILDGLIVLTKRGNSIYSCGNLKDLHQVIKL